MIRRLVPSVISWSQAFSIRVKILGLAVGSVALMGLAAGMLVQSNSRTAFGDELELRGISIAGDLADRAVEPVLTANPVALLELLRDSMGNNADVLYAAVLGPGGTPLAHTFDDGYPSALLNLPGPAAGESHHVEYLSTDAERIRDITVRILGGAAGTVRVGMSEHRMNQAITRTTRMLWLTFLGVAGLVLGGAYIMTQILIGPVLSLVHATRAVAAGQLTHRAPPGPPDEIGLLVGAFNDMVERLSYLHSAREELLDRLITAQEEERRRIARELHDETSQAITSLTMGLSTLSPDETSARGIELRQLATRTLKDLHRLVLELRPMVLDELGLVAAVRRCTADFSQRFDIAVDLQTLGREETRLPSRVEICLYRIIQESLTNVARHSRSSHVSVVLDLRPEQVTVIVEDSGTGFDPEEAFHRHGQQYALGLHGMRERAALVGGMLEIESSPQTGTTVFVTVPLEVRESAAGTMEAVGDAQTIAAGARG